MPDILNCNIEKDYQILIIFDTNISDTNSDQMNSFQRIFRWFCFPQVVQKQTLGEVEY